MQRIGQNLDRSRRLEQILTFISGRLANYRGVPIIVGILLVIVSLPVQLFAAITGLTWLLVLGIVILHVAVLSALIGILLAEPLGKG